MIFLKDVHQVLCGGVTVGVPSFRGGANPQQVEKANKETELHTLGHFMGSPGNVCGMCVCTWRGEGQSKMSQSERELVALNLLILHKECIKEPWYSFITSREILTGQKCLQHIKQQPGGAHR